MIDVQLTWQLKIGHGLGHSSHGRMGWSAVSSSLSRWQTRSAIVYGMMDWPTHLNFTI